MGKVRVGKQLPSGTAMLLSEVGISHLTPHMIIGKVRVNSS